MQVKKYWIGTNASGALASHNLCRNLKIPTIYMYVRAGDRWVLGEVASEGRQDGALWWVTHAAQAARAGQGKGTRNPPQRMSEG